MVTKSEKERIAVLEEKVDKIDKSLGEHDRRQTKTEVKRDERERQRDVRQQEFETKLWESIENLDQKYASKTVEKIVYGMVATILLSVLYLILSSIGIR